jgi:hypothetical protein
VLGEWESACREARWPDVERLFAAFVVARDLDTCRDLLAGRPVAVSRLDPDGVRAVGRRTLVQLRAPVQRTDVEAAA